VGPDVVFQLRGLGQEGGRGKSQSAPSARTKRGGEERSNNNGGLMNIYIFTTSAASPTARLADQEPDGQVPDRRWKKKEGKKRLFPKVTPSPLFYLPLR